MDEMQAEKERIHNIEGDLIKKLRVVEMKAKEISMSNTNSAIKTMPHPNLNKTTMNNSHKQLDNWMIENNQEQGRSLSINKSSNSNNKVAHHTQQRFYDL